MQKEVSSLDLEVNLKYYSKMWFPDLLNRNKNRFFYVLNGGWKQD